MAEKKSSLEQLLDAIGKAYKAMTKSVKSVHNTVFLFFVILLFLGITAGDKLSSVHGKDTFVSLIICATIIFLLKIIVVKKTVPDENGGTKEIEESYFFQLRKWLCKNPQILFWIYFSLIGNFLYIAFHR